MSKTTSPSSASQASQLGKSLRSPERQPPPCTTITAGRPCAATSGPERRPGPLASPGGSQTSALRTSPPDRAYGTVSGERSAKRSGTVERSAKYPVRESGTPSAEAVLVACATGASEVTAIVTHNKVATSELLRAPARPARV